MPETLKEHFSHEQTSINHPIRRLRRHLPYLGKADHQAAKPPEEKSHPWKIDA